MVATKTAAVTLLQKLTGSCSEQEQQYDVLQPCYAHLEFLRKKRIDSVLFMLCERQNPLQRVYQKAWALQLSALQEFGTLCREQGVQAVTLKGAELVGLCFDGINQSGIGDLDLLVDRSDLVQVRRALEAAGFRQAMVNVGDATLVDVDHLDVAEHDLKHGSQIYALTKLVRIDLDPEELLSIRQYEKTPFFIISNECWFTVTLDIHYCLVAGMPVAEFLERSVPSVVSGLSTLSPADHIWFISVKHYHEVFRLRKYRLRDLAYVIRMWSSQNVTVDQMIENAFKYETVRALYYMTSLAAYFCGRQARSASEILMSYSGSEAEMDCGWPVSRLFGVKEEFPECVLQ